MVVGAVGVCCLGIIILMIIGAMIPSPELTPISVDGGSDIKLTENQTNYTITGSTEASTVNFTSKELNLDKKVVDVVNGKFEYNLTIPADVKNAKVIISAPAVGNKSASQLELKFTREEIKKDTNTNTKSDNDMVFRDGSFKIPNGFSKRSDVADDFYKDLGMAVITDGTVKLFVMRDGKTKPDLSDESDFIITNSTTDAEVQRAINEDRFITMAPTIINETAEFNFWIDPNNPKIFSICLSFKSGDKWFTVTAEYPLSMRGDTLYQERIIEAMYGIMNSFEPK